MDGWIDEWIPPGAGSQTDDYRVAVLDYYYILTIFSGLCFSEEMMGHPDLRSECDINTLEPLLHQDVVDDLLSKYVKTFTVRRTHTHTAQR